MKLQKHKRGGGQSKKFKSSFAAKRIQKPGQKNQGRRGNSYQSGRGSSTKNQDWRPKEKPEEAKMTHKQERVKSKQKQKESDNILKLQIEAGLQNQTPEEKLREILKQVSVRGLKQRLGKKIGNHFAQA